LQGKQSPDEAMVPVFAGGWMGALLLCHADQFVDGPNCARQRAQSFPIG
jgi:hypothetical protein